MADKLRVALMTREYPPHVYGGAGVHVEYLARELARHIHVDVHCWGDQTPSPNTNPSVIPHQPAADIATAPDSKFKAALEALSINLAEVADLNGSSQFKPTDLRNVDLVHTHTWYVAFAGFLAKMLYRIPFVLTTHSLEPLRAWKAEQLGTGYALSSWAESTAIHAADAIIAVSQGTRADILRAYPGIDPARIHVIYNGIDLHQYRRTSDTTALHTYGIDPTRPYVLFVGRITRQKGVTHLVDAIQYLPPDTQVVLCAGAPDTPEIAAEMRTKVEAARAARQARKASAVILTPSEAKGKDLLLKNEPQSGESTIPTPQSPSSQPSQDRVPHVPTWGHGTNEPQSGEPASPATKAPSSRPESQRSGDAAESGLPGERSLLAGVQRPLYLSTSEPQSGEPAPNDHQNIIWIEKMVTKEETIQLYSHCRVFCCPSVYEPFGIINLEAMACEAPVVASATGGILEVVIDPGYQQSIAPAHPQPTTNAENVVILSEAKDLQLTNEPRSGESKSPTTNTPSSRPERSEVERPLYLEADPQTGYLVPFTADPATGFPTNPAQFAQDLAAKLNDLLTNEQKARQLGQNGRHRAETHFSWQTIAQQTITLYQLLTNK